MGRRAWGRRAGNAGGGRARDGPENPVARACRVDRPTRWRADARHRLRAGASLGRGGGERTSPPARAMTRRDATPRNDFADAARPASARRRVAKAGAASGRATRARFAKFAEEEPWARRRAAFNARAERPSGRLDVGVERALGVTESARKRRVGAGGSIRRKRRLREVPEGCRPDARTTPQKKKGERADERKFCAFKYETSIGKFSFIGKI